MTKEQWRSRSQSLVHGLKIAGLAIAVMGGTLALFFVSLTIFQIQRMRRGLEIPPMSEPQASDRIVLVVAHPDDEFLSSAGYLQRARRAGAQVGVVIITSGEVSVFADIISQRRIWLPTGYYIQEGDKRQAESTQALAGISIPSQDVFFLGFPTRGLQALLTKNWSIDTPYRSRYTHLTIPPFESVFEGGTSYSGEALVHDLEKILAVRRPTMIIMHSPFDELADHRAAYYMTKRAIQQMRSGTSDSVLREFSFLVHYRQYSLPARANYQHVLLPPSLDDPTLVQWLRFDLTPEEFAVKQNGMAIYRSQFANPYLRLLLTSFIKHNELFYREPLVP